MVVRWWFDSCVILCVLFIVCSIENDVLLLMLVVSVMGMLCLLVLLKLNSLLLRKKFDVG